MTNVDSGGWQEVIGFFLKLMGKSVPLVTIEDIGENALYFILWIPDRSLSRTGYGIGNDKHSREREYRLVDVIPMTIGIQVGWGMTAES